MSSASNTLGGGVVTTTTAPASSPDACVCALCMTDDWESDCCKTQHNHILGDDDDIVCCRCFVKEKGHCPDAWRYLEEEVEMGHCDRCKAHVNVEDLGGVNNSSNLSFCESCLDDYNDYKWSVRVVAMKELIEETK